MAKVQSGTMQLHLDYDDLKERLHFKIFGDTDRKQAYFSIDFAEPFTAPPAVMTSISGVQTSDAAPGCNGSLTDLNFTVSCASANAKGFDLLLDVGRRNALISVTVSWIAIEKGA